MNYKFTIRYTESNSKIFGACEICGKEVVQVYHQKRYEKTQHPITKNEYNKFISDCYGHYDCLIKIRNNESLQCHKDFINSLTKKELESIMKPFDEYET